MTHIAEVKCQIGNQSVFNTAVNPTVQLLGVEYPLSMPPSLVSEIIRDARGGFVPGRDTVDLRHEVTGVQSKSKVYYDQLPYYLDALNAATPSGSGPYVYGYAGPTASAVSPRYQTLVYGAGDGIYGLIGACARSVAFSWAWGDYLRVAVDWMGYKVASDAFASLSESTGLTVATAAHLAAYVDEFAGTIGSTAVNCISGEIVIDPQREYERYGGDLGAAGVHGGAYWNVTGKLTLKETSATGGFVAALIAGVTKKLFRAKFTNGASGANERSLQIDWAGMIKVDNLFTDDNGLKTVDLAFEPVEEGDWTSPGAGEIDGYLAIDATTGLSKAY